MKRLLIGSTAIVCAGMLMASGAVQAKKAKRISLSLSGYSEAWLGYAHDGNEDATGAGDRTNFDIQIDSEIRFKGKTTLDNGIKIGVAFEASTDTGDDFSVDETMIYLSGSFGRVNLGAEDGASDRMQFGADKVGEIGYNSSGIGKWVATPDGHAATTAHALDLGTGDIIKITYFTPRIEGLQVGVSYAPEESSSANLRELKTGQDNDVVYLGVNYVKKLGGANVALAFGYMTKDTQQGNLRPNEDGFSLGARIKTGGFTVGAAYLEENNEQLAGTDDDSFQTWDIAVNYKTGKNTIGIGYLHSEAPGSKSVTGDDETDLYAVEYARSIGPGVSLKASLAKVDYEGENAVTTDDNDGWVAVMGFTVSF